MNWLAFKRLMCKPVPAAKRRVAFENANDVDHEKAIMNAKERFTVSCSRDRRNVEPSGECFLPRSLQLH